MDRDTYIQAQVNDGYSKEYVLEQERLGYEAYNKGLGSGHLSDMACDFYVEASKFSNVVWV